MEQGKKQLAHSRDETGSAMLATTLAVMGLAVFSVSILQAHLSNTNRQAGLEERLQAQYVAEAAVAAASVDLSLGGNGMLFSQGHPLELANSESWIEVVDGGGGEFSLRAGGISGAARLGVESVLELQNSSVFAFGAFGDEGVTMDSNAFVDSYDSSDGAYSAIHGSGSSAHGSSNGAVGSNGNIALDQNAKVFGSLSPGPDSSAIVLGNAEVSGSTTPMSTAVALPEVTAPTGTSLGDVSVGKNSSYTLPAGEQVYGNLTLGSNADLTLVGPATYVFSNFEIESGSEVVVDASAGPVEIFVKRDFLISSNTLIASTDLDPLQVSFVVLSDNIIDPEEEVDLDEVDFDSNAKVYASILAPHAKIEINSNFELFGAIAAKSLHLDSNCKIHYDEALAESSKYSSSSFAVAGWMLSGYPGS